MAGKRLLFTALPSVIADYNENNIISDLHILQSVKKTHYI